MGCLLPLDFVIPYFLRRISYGDLEKPLFEYILFWNGGDGSQADFWLGNDFRLALHCG